MSPTAFLIGRETVTGCGHQLLTNVVERLLATKTTRELYSIVINRKHELTINKVTNADRFHTKHLPTDEGFESDIDSASLLSSDGDSVNCFVEKSSETQISDSANSSSASDSSDTEAIVQKTPKQEHFQLDNVVCYTNIRFPIIIGFVIKKDTLHDFIVFEFSTTESYDRIRYAFNSLNNAAINKNVTAPNPKFNLIQRTDKNGVTHIEISRENSLTFQQNLNNTSSQPSSIISINTPEVDTQADRNLLFDFKLSNLSKIRSNSHADLLNDTRLHPEPQQIGVKSRSNSHANLLEESQFSKSVIPSTLINKSRSSSHADILTEPAYRVKNSESNDRRQEIDGVIRADIDAESIDTKKLKTLNVNLHRNEDPVLKKVWRSAEDILDKEPPKKPERRRKVKGRAPPPPNVMKGQYVRVSVDPNKKTDPSPSLKLASFESNKLDNYNSNWVYVASQPSSLVLTTVVSSPQVVQTPSYDSFKNSSTSEFRTEFVDHRAYTLNRKNREMVTKNFEPQKWTNSVPRMPKVPRSRSENRYTKNNSYKFVDATNPVPYMCTNNFPNCNRYNPNNNFSTHSLPTVNNNLSTPNSISNRLFGLSQKLKEFSTNVVNTNHKFVGNHEGDSQRRRSSLGELSYKSNVGNLTSRYGSNGDNSAGNLKSVIKKNDDRKIKNNNEKKVTFSAFATVQVV